VSTLLLVSRSIRPASNLFNFFGRGEIEMRKLFDRYLTAFVLVTYSQMSLAIDGDEMEAGIALIAEGFIYLLISAVFLYFIWKAWKKR